MKLQHKYNRFPHEKEYNDGTNHIETAGYLPAKKQIEALMTAGRRLELVRHEQYDNYAGQEDDELQIDVTRHRDFDMADASQIMYETEEKLQNADSNETDVESENVQETVQKAADQVNPGQNVDSTDVE